MYCSSSCLPIDVETNVPLNWASYTYSYQKKGNSYYVQLSFVANLIFSSNKIGVDS